MAAAGAAAEEEDEMEIPGAAELAEMAAVALARSARLAVRYSLFGPLSPAHESACFLLRRARLR